MHERFRRRLEVLEEARKLQDGPVQMRSIYFVDGDGTRVVPTMAWSGNFECWRREGEDELEFRARARAECRATNPRPPMVLIFDRRA
jgi:hypothetical protein